jgi:hypothetical protein
MHFTVLPRWRLSTVAATAHGKFTVHKRAVAFAIRSMGAPHASHPYAFARDRRHRTVLSAPAPVRGMMRSNEIC